MSTLYYGIQIYCKEEDYTIVSSILGVQPKDTNPSSIWEYEVIVGEDDEPFYFINEFLDMLEGKYDKLNGLDIGRNAISLWLTYDFDEQCNMEFHAKELKRMGDNEINLCISCY